MIYPLISIVTPSFNQGHFLEETITSVLDQQYPNLEYIIIDGGSTDHSVEIIKKYAKYLSYWISEKDKGQANAINKGLAHCSGSIFNWLNSDDYLEQGALLQIAQAFEDPATDMVAGCVRNFNISSEEIIPNQLLSAEGLMCWKPGVKFVQPGVWMRRELLEKAGGIDEQFHYAFDWDLYIRYLYHYPNVQEISDLLVHFRLHEQSKTQAMSERFHIEERKIIEKLGVLNEFKGLHKACKYKIAKADWTSFLTSLSQSQKSFGSKAFTTLSHLMKYRQVSFTRQTAGALKAFWEGRKI